MGRSKKGLTSTIAEDSMAFDATFDQLTFHADFLDEVANLLRTAQARLLIAAAASVHRQAAYLRAVVASRRAARTAPASRAQASILFIPTIRLQAALRPRL